MNKFEVNPLALLLIILFGLYAISAIGGLTGTQDCASVPAGSSPACVAQIGGSGNSGNIAPAPISSTTTNINVDSATTYTQLVAASSGKAIYITHFHLVVGGTVNPELVYGTGSNCGSGTTILDGPLPLVANSGYSAGSGLGAIMVVPVSNALCLYTDQAVQVSGAISTAQF